jgi:competence protein ComEC
MKKLKLFISFVVAFFFMVVPMSGTTNAATKNMYVHFINVGQGDSIYIKAPNGEDILIDGGNNNYGDDVVAYLKKQKVDDIEIMIATHPDADHIGGLDTVLSAFRVEQVYAPKVSHTSQTYKDFLTAVKREGLKIKTAQKGVSLGLKGVSAVFVGPVKSYSTSDTNDWSAVLKLTYGKRSFLFTGDAETKAEADMIASKQNLRADVLKVGHHGAKTSTSAAFLNAVKPSYAVISVGKGNHYGHPTAEVLNRLKAYKVNIFRTDLQGTIIAKTDGTNLSFNVKPATIAISATTPVKPAPKPPVKKPAPVKSVSYKLTASLDNRTPKKNSTIHLLVKGLPGGTYKAVFHYKSKDTIYTGTINKPLAVRIGRATSGFTVKIDITAAYKGKTYKTQTSFTPR